MQLGASTNCKHISTDHVISRWNRLTIWLSLLVLVYLQCHRSQEDGRDSGHDRSSKVSGSGQSDMQHWEPVQGPNQPASLARSAQFTHLHLSSLIPLHVMRGGLTKRDTGPLADPFNGHPYSCHQKLFARLMSEILTVCWLKAMQIQRRRSARERYVRPIYHVWVFHKL